MVQSLSRKYLALSNQRTQFLKWQKNNSVAVIFNDCEQRDNHSNRESNYL